MDPHPSRRSPGLSVTLALALLAAAPAFAADPDPVEQARAAVTSLLGDVAKTAHDPELKPDEKRALVERQLRDHLDLHALASAAVGALGESMTPEQRVDFAREYERFLLSWFVRQVAGGDQNGPQVSEAVLDPATGAVVVRALGRSRPPMTPGRVAGAREASRPIPWDFRLRYRQGRWQIVSVRVNNVDVGQNFRAQTASVLQRSDADALITELRTRNLADEASNPFQP